ncbi:MAG: hypothetical protein ACR2NZ_08935, partial [Rubripirellula sp.]
MIHPRSIRHILLALIAIVPWLSIACGNVGGADNWPQWRGPAATGSSSTATPPLTWSPNHNVDWRVEVPG